MTVALSSTVFHTEGVRMGDNSERERSGPTDEVGSEGGSPGDVELDTEHVTTVGNEATSTIAGDETEIRERDRQLTRDDRPAPRPDRPRR